MKWLVRFFIVTLLGVAIALFARQDTGYVLITREPWVVETSLTMFILLTLVSFAVLYGVIRFIINAWGLSGRVHHWQTERHSQRARKNLNKGLLELAHRHWSKAEKLLLKNVKDSDTPLINYLAAASAAQEQGEDIKRDEYLQSAHECMPEAEVAISLTQADLQLRQGQLEQALASLMHLRSIAPKHAHVLKLIMRLYIALCDWQSLTELAPELRKRKVASEEHIDHVEAYAYERLLFEAEQSNKDFQELIRIWLHMPKRLNSDVRIAYRYAMCLNAFGDPDRAVAVIRDALHKQWHPSLVYAYGIIEADDSSTQLTEAEVWLKNHGTESVLLLTLGRLAIRNELWGKARAWLEASMGSEPRIETCRLLGSLLEQLGEADKAAEYYRNGLKLAVARVPELPALPDINERNLSLPIVG